MQQLNFRVLTYKVSSRGMLSLVSWFDLLFTSTNVHQLWCTWIFKLFKPQSILIILFWCVSCVGWCSNLAIAYKKHYFWNHLKRGNIHFMQTTHLQCLLHFCLLHYSSQGIPLLCCTYLSQIPEQQQMEKCTPKVCLRTEIF